MATDKKERILAALRTVDPLPTDLIADVENTPDADVDDLYKTWMRRTKDDWKDERKDRRKSDGEKLRNDGADIFNALHPTNHGVEHEAEEKVEHPWEKRIVVQRANTVSISSLDREVIIAEGFKVESCSLLSCTDDIVNLDLFEWDERKECAQHDKYIPYLSALLNYDEFLSVTVPPSNKMLDNDSLRIPLKGTTAAVIRPVGCLEEVICIGEWKKVVNESHLPQLHGELISANSKFPDLKPFGVLSDLRDCWIICWIDGKIIRQVTHECTADGRLVPLTRNTAVTFLRNFSLAAILTLGRQVFRHSLDRLAGQKIVVDSEFADRKAVVVKVAEEVEYVTLRQLIEEEEVKKSRTLDWLNGKDNFDLLPDP